MSRDMKKKEDASCDINNTTSYWYEILTFICVSFNCVDDYSAVFSFIKI